MKIVGQGAYIYKCNNTVDKKNINMIGEELKGFILEKSKRHAGNWKMA